MKRNLLILFLAFGMTFFITRTTMAQDATVEANPVSIVTAEPEGNTTVEDGGTVINIEAPAPVEAPVTPVDNSPLAWVAIGLSAITGILVALSLFLQRVGNRAEAVSNDPSAVSLLERGYDTVLPEIVKSIVQPLKESLERSDQAVDKLLALLDKITDGVPEASKPITTAPASSVSSTGNTFESTSSPMP